MSRLHELTQLQRQFAEEHQDTVFRFLSHKGLPVEDYYDIVIFGYLQAVQEYDENPALSRFHFSTVAWKKMNDCLVKHYTYESRPVRKAPTVNIHARTKDGLTLDEILPDRRKGLQERAADRLFAMEVLSCLTETERQMVCLKADGLTCREIAEVFSTTVHGINGRFRRMRMRLTEMNFEKE
ncbi:MAG: sigma-70 family RNA polymerase sigma factor [bacterium]|nr:sigma-70 family RNA polymerase sigma factor [bacterium]